jgi:CheY-like chemotaxis protein
MSRILLADHSPHAQRMGERILRDEGFEVATVTDGETALLRLKDLAPDLILADVSLPSRNGYEVCEYVKTSGKYPSTRVILTAGPVTAYDEGRAQSAGSDGFVRKPFEASVLLGTLQPLVEKPEKADVPRTSPAAKPAEPVLSKPAIAAAPAPKPIDREQVRAAVILALEASMITMIENITDKVVVALETETRPAAPPPVAAKPAAPPAPKPVPAEIKTVSAAAPKPAVPATPPAPAAESKPEPAPVAPATEPVVRIRTPLFRSLS